MEFSKEEAMADCSVAGIYFSGTGNTKFCLEKFLTHYESRAKTFSIEDGQAVEAIKRSEEIVFAYPVYFSNMPKIVCDFINRNRSVFSGKKIFVMRPWAYSAGMEPGVRQDFLQNTERILQAGFI